MTVKVFGRSHYACHKCKLAKIKCSGQSPCTNCGLTNSPCAYPIRDRKLLIMESEYLTLKNDLLTLKEKLYTQGNVSVYVPEHTLPRSIYNNPSLNLLNQSLNQSLSQSSKYESLPNANKPFNQSLPNGDKPFNQSLPNSFNESIISKPFNESLTTDSLPKPIDQSLPNSFNESNIPRSFNESLPKSYNESLPKSFNESNVPRSFNDSLPNESLPKQFHESNVPRPYNESSPNDSLPRQFNESSIPKAYNDSLPKQFNEASIPKAYNDSLPKQFNEASIPNDSLLKPFDQSLPKSYNESNVPRSYNESLPKSFNQSLIPNGSLPNESLPNSFNESNVPRSFDDSLPNESLPKSFNESLPKSYESSIPKYDSSLPKSFNQSLPNDSLPKSFDQSLPHPYNESNVSKPFNESNIPQYESLPKSSNESLSNSFNESALKSLLYQLNFNPLTDYNNYTLQSTILDICLKNLPNKLELINIISKVYFTYSREFYLINWFDLSNDIDHLYNFLTFPQLKINSKFKKIDDLHCLFCYLFILLALGYQVSYKSGHLIDLNDLDFDNVQNLNKFHFDNLSYPLNESNLHSYPLNDSNLHFNDSNLDSHIQSFPINQSFPNTNQSFPNTNQSFPNLSLKSQFKTPGIDYYLLAQYLFHSNKDSITVPHIQSALLLGIYAANIAKFHTVYTYFGIALRSAVSLNMHRKKVYHDRVTSPSQNLIESNDEVIEEIHKRLWWSIFVIEIIWATKTVHYQYTDTDVDLPNENVRLIGNDPFDLKILDDNVHLTKYIAKFIRLIYGPNMRTFSVNYINTNQFNQKLLITNIIQCYDDLITHVEPSILTQYQNIDCIQSGSRTIANLILRYHQGLIMISTPLIPLLYESSLRSTILQNGDKIKQILIKATYATNATIQILSRLYLTETLFVLGYWDSQYIFFSILYLILVKIERVHFNLLAKAIALLKFMAQNHNSNAINGLKKLYQIKYLLSTRGIDLDLSPTIETTFNSPTNLSSTEVECFLPYLTREYTVDIEELPQRIFLNYEDFEEAELVSLARLIKEIQEIDY